MNNNNANNGYTNETNIGGPIAGGLFEMKNYVASSRSSRSATNAYNEANPNPNPNPNSAIYNGNGGGGAIFARQPDVRAERQDVNQFQQLQQLQQDSPRSNNPDDELNINDFFQSEYYFDDFDSSLGNTSIDVYNSRFQQNDDNSDNNNGMSSNDGADQSASYVQGLLQTQQDSYNYRKQNLEQIAHSKNINNYPPSSSSSSSSAPHNPSSVSSSAGLRTSQPMTTNELRKRKACLTTVEDASNAVNLTSVPKDRAGSSSTTTTKGKGSAKPSAAETKKNKAAAAAAAAAVASGAIDEDDNDGPNFESLTDAQKSERLSRNREHAKRSRLRKRFLLESLQDQILTLEAEIKGLRKVVRSEVKGKRAEDLLRSVNPSTPTEEEDDPASKQAKIDEHAEAKAQHESEDNLTYKPVPLPSGFGPVKTLMEPDYSLLNALNKSQQNFAISDPTLPDNPIVFCSQGFLNLTGYKLNQVLGRNCRFLQGPSTDANAVKIIRKGIEEGVDTGVCLLNYKADGTPFWNQFFVAALRDENDDVVNFVGVQCEVSKGTVELLKKSGSKSR